MCFIVYFHLKCLSEKNSGEKFSKKRKECVKEDKQNKINIPINFEAIIFIEKFTHLDVNQSRFEIVLRFFKVHHIIFYKFKIILKQ